MVKSIFLIIAFFIFFHFLSFPQTKQSDTLQSIETIYRHSIAFLPAYYKELSEKLELSPINKNTDSFSLRLWTGSMFGYELSLLTKNKDKMGRS